MQKRQRWFVPLIIAIIIICGDQFSKMWIVQELGPEPAMKFHPIIGDWFRLVYSQNTGIAFNFFTDLSPIFIVTTAIICGVIIYGYRRYLPNDHPLVQVCIGLIMGGAIGNVIDRITYGFVVDFIQVGWWPVFNIADTAISTGAIVLIFFLWLAGDGNHPIPPTPHDDTLLHSLLNKDVK